MCVNNLHKVATQWNSGATRDSNRGRRVLIPSVRRDATILMIVLTINWPNAHRYGSRPETSDAMISSRPKTIPAHTVRITSSPGQMSAEYVGGLHDA